MTSISSVKIYCFDEPIFFFEKRSLGGEAWYFRNEVVTNEKEVSILNSLASNVDDHENIIFRNRSYEGLSISVEFK